MKIAPEFRSKVRGDVAERSCIEAALPRPGNELIGWSFLQDDERPALFIWH
jgi:hypothetical protein